MDKLNICSKIADELYDKYSDVCEKEEMTKDLLYKNVKESYEMFFIKYNKSCGDFESYITQSINEDIIISLGLEEPVVEEELDEIDEFDSMLIEEYEEKYKNIEKNILNSKGPLNQEEKEILAAKNIPLIHSIVKHFGNTGIEYNELLSAGYVGYAKALDSFEKGKNVKFSTYAYRCIKNEILYFLRREKRHRDNDISLSKPISTDKNGNVMTVDSTISTESQGHKSLEEEIAVNEEIKIMLEVINTYLSDTEIFIIKSRYGLYNSKPKTQKEIADEIGMSQANVSKLEKNISDKIKKVMSSKYKIKSL